MAMVDTDIETLIARVNELLVLVRAASPSATVTAKILQVQNQLDFIGTRPSVRPGAGAGAGFST